MENNHCNDKNSDGVVSSKSNLFSTANGNLKDICSSQRASKYKNTLET